MARFVGRSARVPRRTAALMAGACAAAFSQAALAAEAEFDLFALSPEQLFEATVIAASRTNESVWDASAAVYVITGADIARSGATSIPEALRLAPGVQVARVNASSWAVSIRGFNSPLTNKLLVLIDGREVYDPLFSGVYWDVQDTALEDVERIEVVRGPGGALWGANAVNGVINIVTKSAADTTGGLVSAAAGNVERGLLTARYGGTLGDSAHWRIYGRYTDRAASETLAGLDAEDEWKTWRGGFRVDGGAGADTFTLQGDAYRSESGQFRIIPQRTAPFAVLNEEEIVAEGGDVLGRWTRELGEDSRVISQAYVDVTTRDQLTLRDERVTFDADVQYEPPTLGAHDIVAGARYRNTSADFVGSAVTSLTNPSRRDELVSVFVQDQIALSEAWRVTLGTKIEDNDYTGVEAQPNARLQWTDGELQTAWASVARAVRTPTALEHEFTSILAVFPPTPAIPVPIEIDLAANPGFKSEELVAYEAGYRRRLSDDVEMDLAVFFNDYDGVGTASRQAPTVVMNPLRLVQDVLLTNMTTAETYGFEGVVNWRAAETLQLSANYSYLDMELEGPPEEEAFGSEDAEGRSPRHQAGVRSQWDATERLALDSALTYVDELPNYEVDSYLRLDARVGWRLTQNVELEVVGQNLLDESHREFNAPGDANATEAPRSVFGRVTWRP